MTGGVGRGDFSADVVLIDVEMLEAEGHELGWWWMLQFVFAINFNHGDENKENANEPEFAALE